MRITRSFLGMAIAGLAIASVASAQDIAKVAATSSVQSECRNSPDGVAIRLLPDGGFMVFSMATGTYDDGADPDDVILAEKEATARAKANLARFMKESISSDEGMESAAHKVKTLTSSNGVESASIDSVRVKGSFERIRSHADALLRGVVALSSQKVPGAGAAGVIRVQLGVSSKTLEAVGRLRGALNGGASEDAEAPAPSASAEANGEDGWIVCEGVGMDRGSAVRAALVEGVSMVYGTRLQSDSRLDERMSSLKSKVVRGGEVKETTSLSANQRDSKSSIMMETQGFVDQYRILLVDKVDDGRTRARIKAHFYNPKKGGAIAVFVARPIMKAADRTRVFDIGTDKRLSGADIMEKISGTIVDSIAAASDMLVYSENDLSATASRPKVNVMADLTPGDELVAAGKQLLTDYLFSVRIDDLKYSRKMGMDKATGMFKQQQGFEMELFVRLTDVETGTPVCNKPLRVVLSDAEIVKLQKEADDADLLGAALRRVAKDIQNLAEEQLAPSEKNSVK